MDQGSDAASIFQELMHVNLGQRRVELRHWQRARSYRAVRAALPRLMGELRLRALLDVPCGDLNWMCAVVLVGIEYVGADVVPALIETNTARYGRAGADMSFSRRSPGVTTERHQHR
jgi:hypothetical protein